jgi:hypothetical protein
VEIFQKIVKSGHIWKKSKKREKSGQFGINYKTAMFHKSSRKKRAVEHYQDGVSKLGELHPKGGKPISGE